MKSWKTTSAAVLAVVIAICVALKAMWDGDAATVADWGYVATAIVTAIGLFFARDNSVTSKDAGAKSKP